MLKTLIIGYFVGCVVTFLVIYTGSNKEELNK